MDNLKKSLSILRQMVLNEMKIRNCVSDRLVLRYGIDTCQLYPDKMIFKVTNEEKIDIKSKYVDNLVNCWYLSTMEPTLFTPVGKKPFTRIIVLFTPIYKSIGDNIISRDNYKGINITYFRMDGKRKCNITINFDCIYIMEILKDDIIQYIRMCILDQLHLKEYEATSTDLMNNSINMYFDCNNCKKMCQML